MSTLATDLRRAPAAKPYAASDSSGGLPTRTDIEGWIEEIDVLSSSAAAYCAAANRIETGADTYVQAMWAPGGTAWEGDAADAAREASYADRGVVYRAADHMRNMAQLVNLGAQHLSQARDRVLDAIADAEGDAFKVGDALTVTDMRRYTTGETDVYLARKSRAEEHRAYIAMRAGVLASEDAEIGAKLQAGAAELEGMIPLSWRTSDDNRSDTIQMVDHEFAPGNEESGSGGASPSADDIRSVLEQLPEGESPLDQGSPVTRRSSGAVDMDGAGRCGKPSPVRRSDKGHLEGSARRQRDWSTIRFEVDARAVARHQSRQRGALEDSHQPRGGGRGAGCSRRGSGRVDRPAGQCMGYSDIS